MRPVRTTAVAIVATLVLGAAGCGTDDGATTSSEPAPEPTPATRTVETEMGPVEIPVALERIVALDEYAALNLLALGIEPVEVWGSYESEIGGRLVEDAGLTLVPASIGAGISTEALVAARPDVIVATYGGGLAGTYEDLATVAPTIALPYSRPWREAITETARIFDRPEVGDALVAVLDAQVEEASVAGEADPPSLSLLGSTYGELFATSNIAPLSGLLEELGYTRPRAQAEGVPDPTFDAAVPISEEVVSDHDADVVVVFSGTYYDADAVTSSPTFQDLPAVVDGRFVVVDGDMWFGIFPFAVFWVLQDLEAIQSGAVPDGIGTIDDADARWADFQELL